MVISRALLKTQASSLGVGLDRNWMRRLLSTSKRLGSSDRGDVMLWVVVAAPFLLIGTISLVSASESWEARREAHAVAASAARSAAQADPDLSRIGSTARPGAAKNSARQRASDLVARQSGSTRYTAAIDVSRYPNSVSVTVTATVDYTFSGFGLPTVARGTASATALEGVAEGVTFDG